MPGRYRSLLLILSLAYLPAVHAQSVNIQPIPDLPLRNVPPSSPSQANATEAAPAGWQFALGGGLSYMPRYEGAEKNRLRFMPLLDVAYNNGKVFLSPLRGIGYNFSDSRAVQYGLRISPTRARYASADPRLNGMSDIGYSVEAGAFLNLRFGPWYGSTGANVGPRGVRVEVGTGLGVPLTERDMVRAGINMNWGNAKYNQTYFGVTPQEAAASGNVLTAYDAGAGIKDYSLTANWAHNFTKQWYSALGFAHTRLAGSAQDSPLVLRRAANSFNLLVGYRF
jgi:outer membrane scaffolding protein for murein synthesis (MipA/OmpV family)